MSIIPKSIRCDTCKDVYSYETFQGRTKIEDKAVFHICQNCVIENDYEVVVAHKDKECKYPQLKKHIEDEEEVFIVWMKFPSIFYKAHEFFYQNAVSEFRVIK